eukprot:6200211-Pleurochrysis_carterae.AAC.2
MAVKSLLACKTDRPRPCATSGQCRCSEAWVWATLSLRETRQPACQRTSGYGMRTTCAARFAYGRRLDTVSATWSLCCNFSALHGVAMPRSHYVCDGAAATSLVA